MSYLSKSAVLLILAAVVLAFAVLIYLAQGWQKDQSIENIHVSGLSYIPEVEILSIIKPHITHDPENQQILLKTIEEYVQEHPYVYRANVSREKVCSLEVKIIERVPIAYYHLKDGSLAYIDTTGSIIPYRTIDGFCDLPTVSSLSKAASRDSIVAKNATKILLQLQKEEYNHFNYKVSEIIYTDLDSSFYFRSISNKKKILFGRADFIEQKLNTLNQYFASELYKKILHEPYLVDVRWYNEIVLSHISNL